MSKAEWGPVEDPPMDRDRTLTLVSIDEWMTIWTGRVGGNVYYSNEDGRLLLHAEDLDLAEEWVKFQADPGYRWDKLFFASDRRGFEDYLRHHLVDPAHVDEMDWCDDCGTPDHEDELHPTNDNHGSVCNTCNYSYITCDHCGDRYLSTTTVNESEVCMACLGARYAYCEECDCYYDPDLGCGGDHGSNDCSCESPMQAFAVRNDGLPLLVNDERITVTLPAGEISLEGINAIGSKIVYYGRQREREAPEEWAKWLALRGDFASLGTKWQAKDGNFTKRLSRHAYKNHALKLPPDFISAIGNIASDHSQAVDLQIEVTRNLNLPADEFGHDDSCWWQSYYHSRCAFKSNGGFGIRAFDEDGDVTGRAWVLPLRKKSPRGFAPTFETRRPDAFMVFNGYGDLSGYTPARVMSHMAGWTYRKVEFYANPMYVNNDAGYLIAPEAIANAHTDKSISFDLTQHSELFDIETKETVNA